MSPTSYQTAPPRMVMVAQVVQLVKLRVSVRGCLSNFAQVKLPGNSAPRPKLRHCNAVEWPSTCALSCGESRRRVDAMQPKIDYRHPDLKYGPLISPDFQSAGEGVFLDDLPVGAVVEV